MDKKRNSSIELLRLIALLMIMLMHGFGNTFAMYAGGGQMYLTADCLLRLIPFVTVESLVLY